MRPHAVGARGKGDKPAVPCPPASRSCCPMASAPCPKPGRGGKSQHLACWELHFPSLQPFPAAVPPPQSLPGGGVPRAAVSQLLLSPPRRFGAFPSGSLESSLPWARSPHWSRGGGLSIPRGSLWGGEEGGCCISPSDALRAPCVPSAPFPWLWPRVRLFLFPLLFTLCSRPHPRAPEPGQPAMRRAFLPLFSANQKQKKKKKKQNCFKGNQTPGPDCNHCSPLPISPISPFFGPEAP